MKRKNSATIKLLENEGLLPSEDKEIIEYGLQQAKIYFCSIVVTLLLGIGFGLFIESVIFLIALFPLRMYAGGYHAETPIQCYIISFITILISFCCIKYVNWNNSLCFILSFLSTIIICYLSPVENNTRKLEEIEKKIFRKRTRIIAVIIYLIIIFSIIFDFDKLVESFLMASVIVCLSLITGYFKCNVKK